MTENPPPAGPTASERWLHPGVHTCSVRCRLRDEEIYIGVTFHSVTSL